MVDDRHQLPRESSNSPPSSMNEGDRRLLLLAAVSQRQREQMMGLGTTQPKKEDPSAALVSKDSPCISDVNASGAASKNTDIRDASGVAPSQKRDTSEATAATNTAAGPNAVTSNNNGMPPLDISKEEPPSSARTQKMKRKVSECTRDASACGGRLRALSETVMSAPTSLFTTFSAPPLKGNVSGHHQSNNVVGGTLPMQMLGHDYHQQIMSMSLAGLSAPNIMMLPMQAGPQPQQMQVMQRGQKTTEQKDGPLKKKRKRKKKDTNSRASTTAQDVPKPKSAPTKDGKPVVFPNQEIFSQMLQMKSLKSPPQAAEALAAHIAPFYSRWKEDKASSMSTATAASSSQWEPSSSVQKTMGGESYQEDPLKIQSRFLEKEMALNREQQEKQLQKYLSQQQKRQRRCTKDVSSEAHMSPMMMCQQHQPIRNTHLSPLPPPSIPGQMAQLQVAQQDYLQRFLQDVENRACFDPSNQQRIMELRHQAVMLEEQMRLREMDFVRERRQMLDMQTVNRLRLQADLLEKQLMM
mmetsp:Transcript_682/g.890  ORF Transcript_682/g.890 Transcript_682/m.890 type:complete len:524 (+) Transcript_682:53-1624(+)